MVFEKISPIVKRIGDKWVSVADKAPKLLENGKVYIKMNSSAYPKTIPNTVLEKSPITDTFVSTLSKKTKIPPKVFPSAMNKGTSILDEYVAFKHFEPFFAEFTDDVTPLVMRKIIPPPGKKIIHISNFEHPYGTIAGTSSINEVLFTDKIRSCAAVAIVDKTQNLQTLMHCFPGQSTKSNEEILKYILSHSKPENLEVSIIPGMLEESGKTISFLVDTIKKNAKNVKLKFLNYPKTKIGTCYPHERAILLHNGEVGFCRDFEIGCDKVVNPLELISYCKIS